MPNTKKKIGILNKKIDTAEQDKSALQEQLYEQIIAEKANFLTKTREKLIAYFGRVQESNTDNLTSLEKSFKQEFNLLSIRCNSLKEQIREDFNNKISDLSVEIQSEITKLKAETEQQQANLLKGLNSSFSDLEGKPLDKEEIKKRLQFNKLEHNIGLKIFGGLGAAMITIGLGFLFYQISKYDVVSTILIALTGMIFLGAGFFSLKKKLDILGKVFLGLGFSILYTSVIYAHLQPSPQLINLWWTAGLCIAITAIVITVAIIYSSEIIMSFSLVGGAIPVYFYIFSRFFVDNAQQLTNFDCNMIFGFIMILQAGILAIAIIKRWKWTKLASYFPLLPALLFASFNHSTPYAGLAMTTSSLMLFQIALLITPYIKKQILDYWELGLLGLNTLLSSTLIFIFMEAMEDKAFMGLAAAVLAITYGGLTGLHFIPKKKDNGTIHILLSSALIFVFIAIPLQFGAQWNTLGWTIMGITLIASGIKFRYLILEILGNLAMFASLFHFIVYETIFITELNPHLQLAKFTLLSVALTVMLIFYTHRTPKIEKNILGALKFFTFTFINALLIYFPIYLIDNAGLESVIKGSSVINWLVLSLIATFSIIYGFFLIKITKLTTILDKVFICISATLISCIVLINIFIHNMLSGPFSPQIWIGIICLSITGLIILANLGYIFSILRVFYLEKLLSNQYLWLITGIAITVWVTFFEITQISESLAVAIAVSYAFLSLIFIIIGFLKASYPLRIFGMVMTIVAIAIAIGRVSWSAGIMTRAFSFIALGLLSIGVVFIYSIVDKKLQRLFEQEKHIEE